MYEETICNKLGLRKKFPRAVLYTRWNIVEIRLIIAKTAIAMLAAKLYIRNMWTKTKIGWIISTIDNKVMIEKGRNTNSIHSDFVTTNKRTWNESITKYNTNYK